MCRKMCDARFYITLFLHVLRLLFMLLKAFFFLLVPTFNLKLLSRLMVVIFLVVRAHHLLYCYFCFLYFSKKLPLSRSPCRKQHHILVGRPDTAK